MRSTTLLKFQSRAQTLTFGLEKQALFINNISLETVPFFCPICECSISNNVDVEAYLRVECCRDCENDFAEVNLSLWNSGNRPEKKEILRKLKDRERLLLKKYVDMEI